MIVIFGLSVMPIVLMGVATAIVAMIIATLNGLDRVPRVLQRWRVYTAWVGSPQRCS